MYSYRILLIILLVALVYGVHMYATYDHRIRNSATYWMVGIGSSIAADILWIWATRILDDNTLIMRFSFLWEVVYKLTALTIPLLLFNVELNALSYVGIGLIAIGGVVLKLAGNFP